MKHEATHLGAKCNFACRGVPKCNLGTSSVGETALHTLLALLLCLAVGCGKVESPVQTPQEVTPTAPQLDAGAAWSTYHGLPSLTGLAGCSVASPLRPLWRFTAGAAVRNTPVVSGGLVLFSNDKGKVFGVDAEGREVWSREFTASTRPDGTPRPAAFDAPLACFAGRLYAVDADGLVFALDAATGEERWRADVGAPVMGTPNGSEEHAALYVIAQDDGALHCFDLSTGAFRWKSEGPSRCDGSPGVGHGKVVYGSCASALHVYAASTGALEHNIAIADESQVASGVAIDGGAVFTGCRSGVVLQANLDTGALTWSVQATDAEIFTTPAVDAKSVVLGGQDGFFYAIERTTGAVRWKFETRGTPVSPVIAGDTVIAASDGTLYLLALADGAERWSYEVSDLITAPAVAGSLVFVGCDDGTVAAFDGRTP